MPYLFGVWSSSVWAMDWHPHLRDNDRTFRIVIDLEVEIQDPTAVKAAGAIIAHHGSDDGPIGIVDQGLERSLITLLQNRFSPEMLEAREGFIVRGLQVSSPWDGDVDASEGS